MRTLLFAVLFGLCLTVCLAGQAKAAEPVFELKVSFNTADLATIRNAGQQVILSRSTDPNQQWKTVWASFAPFVNNFVSWNSSGLSVYAAVAPPSEGKVVSPGSWASALPGLIYPFEDWGAFGRPHSPSFPLSPGELGIYNNDTTTMTFGLAADVNVNGAFATLGPISAELLLAFEHQFYQPTNSVTVFLGQPKSVGLLTTSLPEIANSRLSVFQLTASAPSLAIIWDANTGRFVQAASSY